MVADKPSVLVIDDNTQIRDVLQRSLSQQGWVVTTVEGGKEGLARYQEEAFDLVLLDLRLPDIDGHEVLERLKAQDAEATVIIMTGHDSLQSVMYAMNLGAVNYLTKPLDLDFLALVVDKALHRQ